MTKSNNIWKFLALMLLIALAFTVYRYTRILNIHNEYANSANDTIKHWKDKYGHEHAQISAVKMTADMYNQSTDSEIVALRKKVKSKDLVQYVKTIVQVSDTLLIPVRDTFYIEDEGDTTFTQEFAFADKYLELNGVLSEGAHHVAIDYNYYDPFTLTTKWYKDKWYKQKRLVIEMVPENPKAHVQELKSVVIVKQPKKWYETKLCAVGLGLIAGILIAK